MNHGQSKVWGPRPRLFDRVREAIRHKHYSYRTEQCYLHWIKRYIRFHKNRHPGEMSESDIAGFLTHLAVERKVSASTQNQALNALLFLYKQVLEREVALIEGITGKVPRHAAGCDDAG